MTTLAHLQNLTDECWALARSLYPDLPDRELLTTAFRSTRILSRCNRGTGDVVGIGFNLNGMVELSEKENMELVAHEVAHVATYWLHRDWSHLWDWQCICAALGGDPNRMFTAQDTDPKVGLTLAMLPRPRALHFEWITSTGRRDWVKKGEHERRLNVNARAELRGACPTYGLPTGLEMLKGRALDGQGEA